jgi:hypothetical protein
MVVWFRLYCVAMGLVVLIRSKAISHKATHAWRRVLGPNAKALWGMERGYQIVFAVAGLFFVAFGLLWPPGWSHHH